MEFDSVDSIIIQGQGSGTPPRVSCILWSRRLPAPHMTVECSTKPVNKSDFHNLFLTGGVYARTIGENTFAVVVQQSCSCCGLGSDVVVPNGDRRDEAVDSAGAGD